MNMETPSHTINRRQFLKSSSGVAIFIGMSGLLPTLISCKNTKEVQEAIEKHRLTAWVQLSEDGQITVYNPAAEMGQGSMTSLPAIFAEEMDADWSKVVVEFSPQEAAIYGSEGWSNNNKIMLSAGSRVTKGYYPIMRKAGAQTRFILMHSAAEMWKVSMDKLDTKAGYVLYKDENKEISFGELVPFLKIPADLPDFTEDQYKDPSEYQFIGKDLARTEIPAKVDGSAQFTMDIQLPNAVYAVLERGKLHGANPVLENEAEIKALNGIIKVVLMDYAIGILADSLEQALAAKKQLKIKWDKSKASGFHSQDTFSSYEKILDQKEKGRVLTDIGTVESAMKKASKVYSADFKNDYVYHAQMEPLNSIVKVSEDLTSAEVWVGSQQGFDSKLGVPQILGIPPENVTINLQYLGGGFGRRSMTDFVTECAILAKEIPGRPVKLMWTREDDLRYGAFRPLTLQRLKAATNAKGTITALSHHIVGDGGNLVASGIKIEYYAIPNQYAEWREASHGIRLKHWRSVGHGPNKFAIECFLDEIAKDQNIDPVDLRRRLMVNSPKALATLEKAATMSGWLKPNTKSRAKGVAFLERSGTLSTGICEISVDRATGKIRVHHFWSAHDAGIIIQPDNVKAQIEGGILMGIGSVLTEQITITDGEVQQSNFNDYHILRMEDIPESVETALIESDESPQGVGESGTPLVACAIANAFLKLTGKNLRHLPFTPSRVLEVLNA
jgi:isoquinoline 1-oxidoreductase beta subunit